MVTVDGVEVMGGEGVWVDVVVVPEEEVEDPLPEDEVVVVSVSPVEPVVDEVGGGEVFVPVPVEEDVGGVDSVSPVEPVVDDVGGGALFVPVDPPVCPVLP